MRRIESSSYPVSIFIAGDPEPAKTICRTYCDETGYCVTVSPTAYVYRGGEDDGLVVGLINYPRFPQPEAEIWGRAYTLALRLIAG